MQKIVNLKKNYFSWIFTERVTYLYILYCNNTHCCPVKNKKQHLIIITIQVHIKQFEYREKGKYICHSFQKVKPIYYIDSLHRIWLTDNENPKFSVSENYNIT